MLTKTIAIFLCKSTEKEKAVVGDSTTALPNQVFFILGDFMKQIDNFEQIYLLP
ncbi:hypothetical protein CTL2C_582 [Chlamydia trachomatis L2c]|nr:hypothetical protein CTL2C_582 [Chlamydia trachomatis L2c]